MLKIRLQGTTNDIKWFLKLLKRDSRFEMNTPSELQGIKGTNKYKRVYAEIYRDGTNKKETGNRENRLRAYGSGVTFARKVN